MASHSDSDHVTGFVEVLKRFNINFFTQNFIKDSDALNTEISNLILNEKVDQYFLKSGDKIFLDKENNIYLEILWPPENYQVEDNNDNSLVIQLVYEDIKVLLTGDASIEVEEKLVQNLSLILESDILKAGHHGSRTSTSEEFLENVKPKFVIISAGKDNRFGHPHQEVLDLVKNYNEKTKILETSVLGSIEFNSDGEEIWLVN